ncbi:hypothetical protein CR513_29323, partial [Mucuna pruriens]
MWHILIGQLFIQVTALPLNIEIKKEKTNVNREVYFGKTTSKRRNLRLPGVEPGSIAWKAIILTVGLQTLNDTSVALILQEKSHNTCLFATSLPTLANGHFGFHEMLDTIQTK